VKYRVERERIVRDTYYQEAESQEAAIEAVIELHGSGIDPFETDTRRVIGDWHAEEVNP